MINSEIIRDYFPSLSRVDNNNNQIIYLDGPGGTQVPIQVIEAISQYYIRSNANTHGEFVTSKETDYIMDGLRERIAEMLGSEGPGTISIGQNMTTLNYSLSRALSRKFKKGDEVIITELDHEANRGPWKVLEEVGVKLIEVRLLGNGTLDYVDFKNKINAKTVMVCMGMSSNALGTLNNFVEIGNYLRNKDCLFLLDAVHYAPHFSINVQELGCDFMLCSAYKFYGPHVSFLYSKPGLLGSLNPDRLIVQDQEAPYIIETGTLNHAACSGVASAIDFISSIGEGPSLREKLESAYKKISVHEFELAKHLYDSLQDLDKITVIGQDFSSNKRTPTVSFVHNDLSPQDVCKKLANENICAWDGHFYALKAIQKLGLEPAGGVTRLGVSLYNTKQEIDRVIEVIRNL
ncbi:MAG: cysteine desulfurase-like protein [Flavobacteriales bacterium]|nr:cysteine desulfurase-like protein [Flavobacteriales bacterium]|tara:strand:- start:1180 stop:2394 length:1215 start_codon:yes stop_codon:yes gene_type:complete